MFYCKRCAIEKGWPVSILKSHGPCEVCKVHTECNDVPSALLLKSEKELQIINTEK